MAAVKKRPTAAAKAKRLEELGNARSAGWQEGLARGLEIKQESVLKAAQAKGIKEGHAAGLAEALRQVEAMPGLFSDLSQIVKDRSAAEQVEPSRILVDLINFANGWKLGQVGWVKK